MKLYYWNEEPNFGDELNPWLWSRLLPEGMLDDDDSTVLVGIGTLINDRLPAAEQLVFLGTGVGYTRDRRMQVQPNWHIYCLRGPVSAAELDLPASTGVCDPGILMRRFFERSAVRHKFAYMPHHSHMNSAIAHVCRLTGMHLIDPTAGVDAVMKDLCATGTLVTECLHGAIVADAIGVPWISVASERVLQSKWQDWAASMGFDYAPLPVEEVWGPPQQTGQSRYLKRLFVAWQLLRARKAEPFLSNRTTLEERTTALESIVENLKRDYRKTPVGA